MLQGYDLQDMQEVAVKMHGLHSNWSDSKKASYVKHAVRESRIHQQLRCHSLAFELHAEGGIPAGCLHVDCGGQALSHYAVQEP